MLVRSFAIWSVLGMATAAAGAWVCPLASARTASGWPSYTATATNEGASPTPAHFVDGKTLLLDGRLGHDALVESTTGGSTSTFVLATITGADRATEPGDAAAPAHLALVVDRSGSMAGTRMNNAVAAAVRAVERMRDGDRATVVAFDTTARVLVPPTVVDGATRPSIEAAIRGMRAGGDTCMSCGLDTATAELDAIPASRDEVKRVLLISDGEATTGIKDLGGLRSLASRARDRGISISTIGVDLAFDEKVMAAIAQEANGKHWFVPDPSALTSVFDQELGGLETSVASTAELRIEPAPGVEVDDVFDRSFRREGSRLVVPLGSFDPREEKTVLLSVRVPTGTVGSQPVAALKLDYRDVVGRRDERCAGTLAVDVLAEGSRPSELDPFVATRVERNRTAHALLEANELFSRGRGADARATLARRQAEVAAAAPVTASKADALPAATAGAAGRVDKDFEAQGDALAHAQASLGAAASAAPVAGAAPSPPAARALKSNQASATDLAF